MGVVAGRLIRASTLPKLTWPQPPSRGVDIISHGLNTDETRMGKGRRAASLRVAASCILSSLEIRVSSVFNPWPTASFWLLEKFRSNTVSRKEGAPGRIFMLPLPAIRALSALSLCQRLPTTPQT